ASARWLFGACGRPAIVPPLSRPRSTEQTSFHWRNEGGRTARNCSPSISSEVDRTNLFPLAKRRRPCLRSPCPTKASNPRGADTSNDSTCHGPGDRCTAGFQSPLGLFGVRGAEDHDDSTSVTRTSVASHQGREGDYPIAR